MENFKGHLTLRERQTLYTMHKEGESDSRTGKVLRRDRSVVWRERKRNAPPLHLACRMSGLEQAQWAHDKACQRRSDCKRGKRGPLKLAAIRKEVRSLLRECRYSPESIADILAQGDSGTKVCGRTIRRWLLKGVSSFWSFVSLKCLSFG